jgi:soluble lytic murein transglycosylase-like protein
MKLRIILLFYLVIVQASASDLTLSQHITKINFSLDKATVTAVTRELGLYPPIMTHIARRESTFNPKAHSRGCVGLTGVNMKIWHKHLIKKGIIKSSHDLWTIKGNLKAGFYIYNKCNKNYKRYRGM